MVGEGSGEEQLFSSESNVAKDGIGDEVYNQLQKLKVLVPHWGANPFLVNRSVLYHKRNHFAYWGTYDSQSIYWIVACLLCDPKKWMFTFLE